MDDGKEDLNFNFSSNSAFFFLYNSPIKSNLSVIFEGLKITGMTNKIFNVAFFTSDMRKSFLGIYRKINGPSMDLYVFDNII